MLFQKHAVYYLSLTGIFGLGIYLLSVFEGNRSFQFLLVVFLACFYALWGIFHHLLHHSITLKIVLEYAVFASLGVALVFFVLQTL